MQDMQDTGWLEVRDAAMVNPKVFEMSGMLLVHIRALPSVWE